MCADTATRFAQFNGPVQADGVTAAAGNRFQPQPAPLGEDDDRNPLTVFFAHEAVENALHVIQREFAVGRC